jgi:hypothetical protein
LSSARIDTVKAVIESTDRRGKASELTVHDLRCSELKRAEAGRRTVFTLFDSLDIDPEHGEIVDMVNEKLPERPEVSKDVLGWDFHNCLSVYADIRADYI